VSILIVIVCAVLLVWAGMVATNEAKKPVPSGRTGRAAPTGFVLGRETRPASS